MGSRTMGLEMCLDALDGRGMRVFLWGGVAGWISSTCCPSRWSLSGRTGEISRDVETARRGYGREKRERGRGTSKKGKEEMSKEESACREAEMR